MERAEHPIQWLYKIQTSYQLELLLVYDEDSMVVDTNDATMKELSYVH